MNTHLPFFLQDTEHRHYILKNHLYLQNRIPEYYTKSLLQKGKKAKAECLFFNISKRIKRISNTSFLLIEAVNTMSLPMEISPVRMGKKIKMIPRISSLFRQTKRSIFVFSFQARTRKFISKPAIQKHYKEIMSSLYFSQESFRQAQNWAVLTTGFFNLRYLNRRWF